MENSQELKIENKHLRALSCIFFLGPIVPMALQRGDYKLKEGDLQFIQSYVKYGTFLDFAFLVYIVLSAFNYMHYSEFMYYVVNVILFGIIGALFFGIYLIFKDQNFKGIESEITHTKIKPGNINILFYYAPIYNLVLWYQDEREKKSYWWIKESIASLSLFVVISLISQPISYSLTIFICVIFIGGYIFRIVSLFGGMDVISDQTKEKIDKLFDNNPEEFFAYIKGLIIFTYKKAKAKNLEMDTTLLEQIEKEKNVYKETNKVKKQDNKIDKFLISQYIILAGLAVFYFYYNFWRISLDILGLIYLLPGVLFICRYFIAFKTKKIPNIPVIYEIMDSIRKTFRFLK